VNPAQLNYLNLKKKGEIWEMLLSTIGGVRNGARRQRSNRRFRKYNPQRQEGEGGAETHGDRHAAYLKLMEFLCREVLSKYWDDFTQGSTNKEKRVVAIKKK